MTEIMPDAEPQNRQADREQHDPKEVMFMKKIRISAVLICLLLVLNACAAAGSSGAAQSGATEAAAGTEEAAASENPVRSEKPSLVIMGQETTDYSRAALTKKSSDVDVKNSALYAVQELPKLSNKDFTVMVYVVGSNLESRYGAATNDMNEMIGAGLDFTRNNLLVYTGGSKRWTSDISNTCNSVINMENGEELEVAAQTSETADMGAASTLAEFINYCTDNFPASHYGLVLWDHGAGPLWGYGSDELFDNDSLLLEELRDAMDQTVFSGDRKLDFVGFDACLMGSIESASLWKDYAHYLVGSEELESGRGWDYSFLSTLNETDDARTIVSSIVEAYGKYYEENRSEFFNPDVTLAAMDLSKADALIDSTNALLTAMTNGIEAGDYADVNRARAKTKAFGLSAASGKEDAYDLLDLRNLAENVMELYPEESRGIHDALDEMVVQYTSNVAGANGVSIYLPGDNFELYGVSEELYAESSALSAEYSAFVDSYMDSWIEGTNTDWSLAEIENRGDELTLQLTEEQVKNASQSYYTVLQRNSFGNYAVTTANIAIEPDENNVLHIPADPMLLNVATDMEEAPAPLTCVQSQDNGGECVYRTISCYLTPGHEFMDVDWDKDEEVAITVRNITGEEEATVLDITSASGSAWSGGKASIDVTNYESLINAGSISYNPQRNADGSMKPFFEWKATGYEMYPLCLDHGFRIEMKPASGFDKDFICQVTVKDVNGNVHGSEYVDLELDHSIDYEQYGTENGTLYARIIGEEAVISGYEGEDTEIAVPAEISGKTVTEIGDEAFSYLKNCSRITLPEGIRTIGIAAFNHSGLEEIEIPSSVETIKRGAFSQTKLTSVSIPESVTEIGSIPFSSCDSLTEITVSGNNPNYKTVDGVLYTRDGKTLIQYPGARSGEYTVESGTETIGYGAFAYSAVESVVLPESLKSIENMAFFECQSLASANMPDSIETIGNAAFGEYGIFSFGDEENPLIESMHIGPNVSQIGNEAFRMMNIAAFDVDEDNPYFASSGGFITSKAKDMILEVPSGIGHIIQIPDGITTLQDYLLSACDDGADFLIPDSVFRFGTTVFPYEMGDRDESGRYKYIFNAKIHCSEGSAAESYARQYEIAYDNMMDPEALVYETVTEEMSIAEAEEPVSMTWRVFADHAELMGFESSGSGTLTIPSTFRDLPVTAIRNDRSGYYSSYFSRIVIPASVEIVENGFFSNYYNLRELEVESGSKSFKSVDGVLFDAEGERLIAYPLNKEDTEYTVPDKTETIGEKAFYFNSSITKVTLPKSVRTIGSSAFAGCSSLTAVEMGKGLKEIGSRAFNGDPLQSVKISSSVTSIGDAAFTVSEGFGRIELPEKLEKLGYSAFSCEDDEPFTQDVIRIPAKLVITGKFLDDILFEKYEVDEESENYTEVDGLLMSRDGTMLVSVPTLTEGDLIIPEGTLHIDYYALEGCDRVTDIYLPDSILSIGNITAKDYETGEYRYVIHCNEGTEAAKTLNAKGVPWVEK